MESKTFKKTSNLRQIEIRTNSGIANTWEIQEEFICLENGETEWKPIISYGLLHKEHPRNK